MSQSDPNSGSNLAWYFLGSVVAISIFLIIVLGPVCPAPEQWGENPIPPPSSSSPGSPNSK